MAQDFDRINMGQKFDENMAQNFDENMYLVFIIKT